MRRVALDGIIYRMQARGGISRMYNEILPRMCNLEPDLRIRLYASPPTRQPLPANPQIKVMHQLRHDLRPSRVWQRVYPIADDALFLLSLNAHMLWHSTYYTLPPRRVKATVITAYDTAYHQFPSLFSLAGEEKLRQQQDAVLKQCDAVIAISQSTSAAIQQIHNIPASKIRVIPLAYSHELFFVSKDSAPNLPTTKPFLLYVGGRLKHKNFAWFIDTYSRWAHRDEVDIVCVGSAWSEAEQQQFALLGIADHLHVIDADDNQLRGFYNHAAAFVYPSLTEGFGIPLLEAMACGCPIVASHIPSSVEVGQDVPYYFDPTDADSLHQALASSLAGGRTAARIQAGLRQVQQYSWETTAAQTLDVYRSLS